MNFFDLDFRSINNEVISFSQFKGKVCLVVNIASRCRFTPQLHDLERLYLSYHKSGFEILAFPSNDFAGQEPLSNEQIGIHCSDDYGITFLIFEKSHVSGSEMNAVFKFLSSKKLNGKISMHPWWNFHKYLIDRNGNVTDYFFSFTRPCVPRVKRAIERLL